MLRVELDNILTEEDALGRIKEIFAHVEEKKQVYVVTKEGKPVFAIVDIFTLEHDLNGVDVTTTPKVEAEPEETVPEELPDPVITPSVPRIIEPPAAEPEPMPTEEPLPSSTPAEDGLPPLDSPATEALNQNLTLDSDLPSMPESSSAQPFSAGLAPLPVTTQSSSPAPVTPIPPAPLVDAQPFNPTSTDPSNSSPLAEL